MIKRAKVINHGNMVSKRPVAMNDECYVEVIYDRPNLDLLCGTKQVHGFTTTIRDWKNGQPDFYPTPDELLDNDPGSHTRLIVMIPLALKGKPASLKVRRYLPESLRDWQIRTRRDDSLPDNTTVITVIFEEKLDKILSLD